MRGRDLEERELQRAVEALARGSFRRAADAYARAARLRARRDPTDPDLHQRSVVLYLAGGERDRARAALVQLRRRAARWAARDRAWVEARLGEIFLADGREDRARIHFEAALSLLPRRHPQAPDLHLAAAHCALQALRLNDATRRVALARRAADEIDDRKGATRALLLAADVETLHESASAMLLAFEEAASFANEEGLLAAEREVRAHWAEVLLCLGQEDDARRQAETAERLAVSLRDPVATAHATLLIAAACTALAERTEREQGAGTAGGLRREAAHHLRTATAVIRGGGPSVRLGEALLWGARLAAFESPTRALRLAEEAASLFERAGLERLALEAEAVALETRRPGQHVAAAWRALAQRAEAIACAELATTAWLAASRAPRDAGRRARTTAPLPADSERLLRRAYAWSGRRGPWTPVALDPAQRRTSLAPALWLAAAAGGREPEPKPETFAWILAARTREAEGRRTPLERPGSLPLGASDVTRRTALTRLHRRTAERSAATITERERSTLWRQCLADLRALGAERFREAPPRWPQLRAGETLVAFARLGASVDVFCLAEGGVLFHAPVMPVESWQAWELRLHKEANEARGWPDGMVPDVLTERARLTLRELGRELWVQLWPSLGGAERVLVLPDPSLPLLPFAASLLAAEAIVWRQPASLTHLAGSPSAVRNWTGKPTRMLAVSSSHADYELGAREARSAARIFAGRVLAGDRLLRAADQRTGKAPTPRELLRAARFLYLAAPVLATPDSGFLASVTLGTNEASLGEVLRDTHGLDLLLLPDLAVVRSGTVAVGRVVGRIDPEGARALPRQRPGPELAANPQSFLAHVLREAAARVLAGTEPETRMSPSPVLGAFCAGLARGDTPGESLLLAQRHAWDEGIHPVLWSGFSLWERG